MYKNMFLKTVKGHLIAILALAFLSMLIILTNQFFYMKEAALHASIINKIFNLDLYMLEMRQAEKDFFSQKNKKYITQYTKKSNLFEHEFFDLQSLLNDINIEVRDGSKIVDSFRSYNKTFYETSDLLLKIGLDENQGYHQQLQEAGLNMEKYFLGEEVKIGSLVSSIDDSYENISTKLILLLQIRRSEKIFLEKFNKDKVLSKQEQYIYVLSETIDENGKVLLDIYSKKFKQIIKAYKEIGINEDSGLISQMKKEAYSVEKALGTWKNQLELRVAKKEKETKILAILILVLASFILLIFMLRIISQLVYGFNHFISFFKSSKDSSEIISLEKNDFIEFQDMASSLNELIISKEASKNKLKENLIFLEKAQEQLIQTEKMAGLGSLVSGVAHEINTPVGLSITGVTYLQYEVKTLKGYYEKQSLSEMHLKNFFESFKKISDSMYKSLEKAAQVVRSFKQVAVDQHSQENRRFELHNYIDDVILSLHNSLKYTKIQIENNISENLIINSDPGVYSHIFTNFIQNSLIHGFQGKVEGKISIEAHIKDDVLYIIYHDTGKGMDTEVLKKMFDPFYTTKRGQGGSGLGLSIVYNLVTAKLNGRIHCDSKLGEGINIYIEIPMKEDK